ncbi:MAG: hypothetical protein ACRD96_12550 [Bryobacteraceae bacterium]
MKEWTFAQSHKAEQLAQLSYFSVMHGEVEFIITVKEFVTPTDPAMLFFAQADKQTNQKTVTYTPSGWGRTMLEALSECVKAVYRFPYEGS